MTYLTKNSNPYPTYKGFGLRVFYAEKAIKKRGFDPWAETYTRDFDHCFENGDGDAVVWTLMHKARHEPDQYGQSLLTQGIQRMFQSSLNGNKYPQDWLDVYHGKAAFQQLSPETSYYNGLPCNPKHRPKLAKNSAEALTRFGAVLLIYHIIGYDKFHYFPYYPFGVLSVFDRLQR